MVAQVKVRVKVCKDLCVIYIYSNFLMKRIYDDSAAAPPELRLETT